MQPALCSMFHKPVPPLSHSGGDGSDWYQGGPRTRTKGGSGTTPAGAESRRAHALPLIVISHSGEPCYFPQWAVLFTLVIAFFTLIAASFIVANSLSTFAARTGELINYVFVDFFESGDRPRTATSRVNLGLAL